MCTIVRNKQILTRVKFIAQPYRQEQNTQTQKRQICITLNFNKLSFCNGRQTSSARKHIISICNSSLQAKPEF
jgi:hypothetical protein